MLLIEEIKKSRLNSRKERDVFRTNVLTTLIGDIEFIGKNAGNRLTTNAESENVIKKFVKNIKDTLTKTDRNSDVLLKELNILNEFLPKETSEEALSIEITNIINTFNNESKLINVGVVMKELKSKFDNFDGKVASVLIRKLL